ncbi:MAG: tRNA (adenosine(37)-N6)-threonylcarbamoyltransferase complex dimerization subunit type 1 TsaB [Bacteroidota bacterium]|nr:tRNA (adenosine(37)-N6)-threonylcarbamoyltransferase complex dimerization subunit type 1 TsaB [Bacteroidota bacterium]
MSYILNIHTATETAIVNLARDGHTLHTMFNDDPKQHAAFLHSAVNELLEKEGIPIKKLDAISITSGPGSYTGIRVGLSAAKGFCYALNIPLITFNTLEVMALSAAVSEKDKEAFYCPMIDARRMEVYTALYAHDLQEIEPPSAKILDENSFTKYKGLNKIIFSGSGSKKFSDLSKNDNFFFSKAGILPESLAQFSWEKFKRPEHENIVSAIPLYIKDFYTP